MIGGFRFQQFGQEKNYRLIYYAERELEPAEIEYARELASLTLCTPANVG